MPTSESMLLIQKKKASGEKLLSIGSSNTGLLSQSSIASKKLQMRVSDKNGVKVLALDTTYIKVYPDGTGAPKKGPQSISKDKPFLMDTAYERDEYRAKAKKCGMRPVVLPKMNRVKPWHYSKKLYKSRYVAECNFRNIKKFRRVFTRHDKLDETYNAFSTFANIAILMRN